MAIETTQPAMDKEWSNGLCDCFGDCGACLKASFCCCCAASEIYYNDGKSNNSMFRYEIHNYNLVVFIASQ